MSAPASGLPGGRSEERRSLRRTLGWALVGALCVMAVTAAVAVLTDDFDETDARVLGTSLGFAMFSATGAAGASLRLRASGAHRAFGTVTSAVSVVAFLLLAAAIWADDQGTLWEAWGIAGISALSASHACIVLGARRAGDSPAVRTLTIASMALGATDCALVVLAILEVVDVDTEEGYPQVLAVLLIAFLLTTALPPILRRLQTDARGRQSAQTVPDPFGTTVPDVDRLAASVLESVARIEAATGDPEVRAECARIRRTCGGSSPPPPRR